MKKGATEKELGSGRFFMIFLSLTTTFYLVAADPLASDSSCQNDGLKQRKSFAFPPPITGGSSSDHQESPPPLPLAKSECVSTVSTQVKRRT